MKSLILGCSVVWVLKVLLYWSYVFFKCMYYIAFLWVIILNWCELCSISLSWSVVYYLFLCPHPCLAEFPYFVLCKLFLVSMFFYLASIHLLILSVDLWCAYFRGWRRKVNVGHILLVVYFWTSFIDFIICNIFKDPCLFSFYNLCTVLHNLLYLLFLRVVIILEFIFPRYLYFVFPYSKKNDENFLWYVSADWQG